MLLFPVKVKLALWKR